MGIVLSWFCLVESGRHPASHQRGFSREMVIRSSLVTTDANTTTEGLPGHVMIDGGSSGSKLFSFSSPRLDTRRSMKVLSQCRRTDCSACRLKGVTVLAIEVATCTPEVLVPGNDGFQTINSKSDFPEMLLNALKKLHQDSTDCGSDASPVDRLSGHYHCGLPTNAGAVPIIATAGMRLMKQQRNDEVWSTICGYRSVENPDYQFAGRETPLCGTIPGTQEAFYEYLANLYRFSGADPTKLRAVFTIGGASAQIALPLNSEQVIRFQGMIDSTMSSCEDVTLDDGEPMPIFNHYGNCIHDFLEIKAVGDIPEQLRGKGGLKHHGISHIGLVSFLGLGKKLDGTFGVAGGVNSINAWAEDRNCSTGNTGAADGYEGCKKKLLDALGKDKLWTAVKELMESGAFNNVEVFDVNTPAASPTKVFNDNEWLTTRKDEPPVVDVCTKSKVEGVDISDIWSQQLLGIEEIDLNLAERSKMGENRGGFGFGGDNNAMKAFFAAQFNKLIFSANTKIHQEMLTFYEDAFPLLKSGDHGFIIKSECTEASGSRVVSVAKLLEFLRKERSLASHGISSDSDETQVASDELVHYDTVIQQIQELHGEMGKYVVEYNSLDWSSGAAESQTSALVQSAMQLDDAETQPAYLVGAMLAHGLAPNFAVG